MKIFESGFKLLILQRLDHSLYGYTLYFDLFMNLSLFYTRYCLRNCYQKNIITTVKNKDQL
jgi:hypothetical protein